MGVRRAVELALTEADKAACGAQQKVFTFGPLIHNPGVLNSLKERGITAIEQAPQNAGGCSIIIRAHGIDAASEEDLRDKGFCVIDATCPNVKKSRLKAQELARAGYCLFLAGETDHAEVQSVLSYAKAANDEFCAVVGNAAEAEEAAKKLRETNRDAKTALLAQTTICADEYSAIGEAVKKHFPNLEIVQTICSATVERQNALRDLLGQVDAVIVAGGKESANTRRLLAIAQESGKPCALVEKASEIPASIHMCETVGLCAGASTPNTLIDEIELELYR